MPGLREPACPCAPNLGLGPAPWQGAGAGCPQGWLIHLQGGCDQIPQGQIQIDSKPSEWHHNSPMPTGCQLCCHSQLLTLGLGP